MERIRISNMGNFFGRAERTDISAENRAADSGNEKFTAESTPHIKITVIHMQPLGTGLQQTMFVDPRQLTDDFKSDLSNVTQVPKGNISLTWRNQPLQDDVSLWQQGVQPDDIMVMKDIRLQYDSPN